MSLMQFWKHVCLCNALQETNIIWADVIECNLVDKQEMITVLVLDNT
jgi:hypothetical protein